MSTQLSGDTAGNFVPAKSPRFCSSCGDDLKPKAKFCSSCGEKVIDNDEVADASVSSTSVSPRASVLQRRQVVDATPSPNTADLEVVSSSSNADPLLGYDVDDGKVRRRNVVAKQMKAGEKGKRRGAGDAGDDEGEEEEEEEEEGDADSEITARAVAHHSSLSSSTSTSSSSSPDRDRNSEDEDDEGSRTSRRRAAVRKEDHLIYTDARYVALRYFLAAVLFIVLHQIVTRYVRHVMI